MPPREDEAAGLNSQASITRGRQPNRSVSPSSISHVPLRFVHVPNNTPALSHRTPSVPDFASLRSSHRTPHLSGDILRNVASLGPMEQFEERLRIAQLVVSQNDMDLYASGRLRSRSTPSRAANRMRDGEDMRRSALRLQQDIVGNDVEVNQEVNNGLNYQSTAAQHTEVSLPEEAPMQQSMEESPSSPKTSLSNAETNHTQLDNRHLSSASSSPPAHRIPSPPPPPPPSSERERLVQRERELRSETERARRRHLALLRERQLEENTIDQEEGADVSDRNDRPTSVGSLEVVDHVVTNHVIPGSDDIQFCDVEHGLPHTIPQSEPDDRGTNEVIAENVLAHHTTNSISIASVESTSHISGISEPPPLPPPTTERERLVLREREARLETERARRRHIALLREQDEDEDHDTGSYVEAIAMPILSQDEADPRRGEIATGCDEPNTILSYTMERFLETLGEEEENALTVDELTVEEHAAANADGVHLPYTMELFLSENLAAVNSGNDDQAASVSAGANSSPIDNEVFVEVEHHGEDDQSTAETVHISANNSSASVEILSRHVVSHENDVPVGGSGIDLASVGGSSSDLDLDLPGQGSQVDDNPVFGQLDHQFSSTPLDNNQDEGQFSASSSHLSDTVDLHINSASLNDGISPLHLSIDDFTLPSQSAPQMPRLTEEGVAQLIEVDHASIGNAPPQSERSEPSESSLPDLVPFHHHAFSVATQTTEMESVTETSKGSANESSHGLIHQRSDSEDVIRIGVSVIDQNNDMIQENVSDNALAIFRASNTSLQAMPSIDSVIDSGSESHILSNSSSSLMQSSPQSIAASSCLSSSECSRVVSLTEQGVVAMEEIDTASIGNVPPRSVRDESTISQSSVMVRGRHDISNARSTFAGSSSALVDTLTANASVEAMPSVASVQSMSEDSVEAMPSEYSDNSLHEGSSDTGNEDIECQAYDMASSTSIEALPSVVHSEDDPFAGLTSRESNGTEDEDLVVYQNSDRASSTSIEALPSDDDLGSVDQHIHSPHSNADQLFDYGARGLNGFSNRSALRDQHLTNGDTERLPLLPISQTNGTNGTLQIRDKISWNATSLVLMSFAFGCIIGICVGVFMIRYRES